MDGVSALILILILSFVIERVAAGLMFGLSFRWKDLPQEAKTGLAYFCAIVLLAISNRYFVKIGVLDALNVAIPEVTPGALGGLDYIVTVIVLAGGAGQLSSLQEAIGAAKVDEPAPKPNRNASALPGGQRDATAKPIVTGLAPEPIQVTGTLTLDEESRKALNLGGRGLG